MRFNSKKKYIAQLSLLAGIFIILLLFQQKEAQIDTISESDSIMTDKIDNPQKLKSSGYWLLDNITIDGDATGVGANNWSWAVNQEWCNSVDGIYVIENVTINGQESVSCINVTDSDVYFVINNCTLYNSSSGANNAGINLFNVN